MKSVKFPEANGTLAESQDEYNTLTVYREDKPRVGWSYTVCFELDDEEIDLIVRNRRLWYTQIPFGKLFHPMNIHAKSPFDPEEANGELPITKSYSTVVVRLGLWQRLKMLFGKRPVLTFEYRYKGYVDSIDIKHTQTNGKHV